MSTGHYIHARDWDKKRKKVKGSNDLAHAKNESLNSLRAQVIMTVNKMVLDGIPFNVHTIVDRLNGKDFTISSEYKITVEKLIRQKYILSCFSQSMQIKSLAATSKVYFVSIRRSQ